VNCLHVISGDLWAGAEVATFNLVRELARRPGIGVSVLLLNDGALARRLRSIPVPTTVIEESRHGFLRLARLARARALHHPVHVVHTHRYKEHLLGVLLAAAAGAHHVRTAHGLPPSPGTGGAAGFAALLDAAIADLTGSTWIAVSRDLAGRLAGLRRSVHVVPNGLPAEPPRPARAELDDAFGGGGGCYVGWVGRLERVKRPDRFVRVMGRLPRRAGSREVRGVLLGDGSLRDEVAASLAPGIEAPPLRLLGRREDGEAIVAALDVLVISSDHEGHPMVLLEAMRSGVPVVATRVGGIPEVLGSCPWVVPAEDEAALARAVSALLDGPARAEWSAELRRRFDERFTIERVVEQVLGIYGSGRPVDAAVVQDTRDDPAILPRGLTRDGVDAADLDPHRRPEPLA
jgi:glycosyltransferase involved in cell wall biosynthesis